MLTEIEQGMKAWMPGVEEIANRLIFVPREVSVIRKEGGMIRYLINKMEWLWYSDQFFHLREEAQVECNLLERTDENPSL